MMRIECFHCLYSTPGGSITVGSVLASRVITVRTNQFSLNVYTAVAHCSALYAAQAPPTTAPAEDDNRMSRTGPIVICSRS
jgi:hypothetical protein